MIIRNKRNWFKMLFIWKGSVLPEILPQLSILFVLSFIVVYFHGQLFSYKIPLNPAPFTLMGVALAIFLGFINNASFDRYWEARKLWGALLNTTRSLARQALTMSGYQTPCPEVTHFIHLLIAFTYSLKHQLRQSDARQDYQRLLPKELATELRVKQFQPVMLLKEMGRWVQKCREKNQLDSNTQAAFDHNFNLLSDVLGGCERIAGTPVPFTYSVLLHRTVYLYCFLLPFGLVDSIGWMTPLIVVFIGYTFIALDAIVNEIEEPFGTAPNDLALSTMSRMIEATLLEMNGEELPFRPDSLSPYQYT
jgi:ion channel-forming bestrophin family protein